MKRAFAPALAALLAGLSSAAPVHAQSSSGNIVGEAKSGDTVLITGDETGFKRELKIDKDGKYQVRRVPTGTYTVVRTHQDGNIDPAQSVIVRPGGSARVLEPGKADAKDVFSGT